MVIRVRTHTHDKGNGGAGFWRGACPPASGGGGLILLPDPRSLGYHQTELDTPWEPYQLVAGQRVRVRGGIAECPGFYFYYRENDVRSRSSTTQHVLSHVGMVGVIKYDCYYTVGHPYAVDFDLGGGHCFALSELEPLT